MSKTKPTGSKSSAVEVFKRGLRLYNAFVRFDLPDADKNGGENSGSSVYIEQRTGEPYPQAEQIARMIYKAPAMYETLRFLIKVIEEAKPEIADAWLVTARQSVRFIDGEES